MFTHVFSNAWYLGHVYGWFSGVWPDYLESRARPAIRLAYVLGDAACRYTDFLPERCTLCYNVSTNVDTGSSS